jgi:3-oxoacyl-[acyl-carrier-protein] synthase II
MAGRSFAERLAWPEVGVEAIGCRVLDDVGPRVPGAERRRLDRIAHLAIVAAEEATADAGWDVLAAADGRRGMVVGIGFGGISTLTSQHLVLRERGWKRLSPFAVPAVMPSGVAAVLAIRHAVTGPVLTVSSACASGTQALGEAIGSSGRA